jgi:hypothetical protein
MQNFDLGQKISMTAELGVIAERVGQSVAPFDGAKP